jgi:hypothetical protein
VGFCGIFREWLTMAQLMDLCWNLMCRAGRMVMTMGGIQDVLNSLMRGIGHHTQGHLPVPHKAPTVAKLLKTGPTRRAI